MATSARVERACEVLHDAYEDAARNHGWATQEASRKPWADVPEANKATMREAVKVLLTWLEGQPDPLDDARNRMLELLEQERRGSGPTDE